MGARASGQMLARDKRIGRSFMRYIVVYALVGAQY